jgi:apolipoprotein N-acyltransferase
MLKSYLLAGLSGVLLALAFPHSSITVLVWIGLIPLLFAIDRSNVKHAPLLGLICGIVFYAAVLYWIQVFGFIAWFALSVFLAVWIGLFSLGAKLVFERGKSMLPFLLLPALWALTEYGRALGPLGFAWANLGATTAGFRVSLLASYIGEPGVSAAIVFVNLALLRAVQTLRSYRVRKKLSTIKMNEVEIMVEVQPGSIEQHIELLTDGLTDGDHDGIFASRISRRTAKRARNASQICIGVAVLSLIVLGFLRAPAAQQDVRTAIKVTLVQPSIPQSVKHNVANDSLIKSRYRTMTDRALRTWPAGPDLLIWPESVFISYIEDQKPYISAMTDLITQNNASFIFGGMSQDEQQRIFNNAIFVDATDKKKDYQSYQKTHLVPFGEYMPLRGFIERINDMADLVDDKTPGTRFVTFDISRTVRPKGYPNRVQRLGKFSTILCFESADSRLVGRMVENGARMIVVITNDGWFGKTAALEQHFQIARMRAIEYGVPVVQAANTGLSGFIDQNGHVIARTAINRQEVLRSAINFASRPSFFAHYGTFLPYLYLAVILTAVLYRRTNSV